MQLFHDVPEEYLVGVMPYIVVPTTVLGTFISKLTTASMEYNG